VLGMKQWQEKSAIPVVDDNMAKSRR